MSELSNWLHAAAALRQTFEKKLREEKKDRIQKTKKLFEIREGMEQDKEMLTQVLLLCCALFFYRPNSPSFNSC